jgi:hypothetical protein
MSVAKLTIPGLLALGFDRVQADALLHLLRQIGAETGGVTLPELAGMTAIDADTNASPAALAELRKEVETLKIVIENRAVEAENAKRIDQLAAQLELLAAGAHVAELEKQVAQLAAQIEAIAASAQLAELAKQVQSVELAQVFQ